jgi:GT2 family glycosyltransferase
MDTKVVVLTVTYGKRWNFLSQVIERMINDPYVINIVIVDNGSQDKEEIQTAQLRHKEKLIVIRSEKNLGSAGGFALGIEKVREIECNFVFMLDDDNVPEVGAIEIFLQHIKRFNGEKVVIVGNRINIPGNEVSFQDISNATGFRGTFFEVFSFQKILHFVNLIVGKDKRRIVPNHASLCVPNESFVYGGAFIPIEAVIKAPLPDKELVLYGDDIEYSWGIKKLGYASYVCRTPKIHDVDMSFGEASQVIGLFEPSAPSFKTYYRVRNMIRISRRNTYQNSISLFINIVVWVGGLCILGALRYGINKNFFDRVNLIAQAVYGGYVESASTPEQAKLP